MVIRKGFTKEGAVEARSWVYSSDDSVRGGDSGNGCSGSNSDDESNGSSRDRGVGGDGGSSEEGGGSGAARDSGDEESSGGTGGRGSGGSGESSVGSGIDGGNGARGDSGCSGVGGGGRSSECSGEREGLPDSLLTLLEGKDVPLDTDVPLDFRPDWLDEDKLARGRKFAVTNLMGVVFAEMLSLGLLFSVRGSLEALIFTGKSHTPTKAFQRYFSTVSRMISWYDNDPWREEGEGRRNLMAVRAMHASVAQRMNSCPPQFFDRLLSLERRDVAGRNSLFRPLQKAFEDSVGKAAEDCPFAAACSLSRKCPEHAIHVNQMELSITQFGFMGLLLLFPDKFGVVGASEADFEAFVHLWRALGHSLGVRDRYNFCSGGLKETRDRCRAVLEKWIKPGMSEVTCEWEHMYRCVLKGTSYYTPTNTIEGSLAYLCWVVGVETPGLVSSLSWSEWLLYLLQRFSLCYLCHLPGFLAVCNILVRVALWRAKTFTSYWAKRYERKNNGSQVEEKYICTRL